MIPAFRRVRPVVDSIPIHQLPDICPANHRVNPYLARTGLDSLTFCAIPRAVDPVGEIIEILTAGHELLVPSPVNEILSVVA